MNKADKLFSSFKDINYRVTTNFGISLVGEKRKAKLICQDVNRALIYHPSDKSGCGNFEIVVLGQDNVWTSMTDESYVNYIEWGGE